MSVITREDLLWGAHKSRRFYDGVIGKVGAQLDTYDPLSAVEFETRARLVRSTVVANELLVSQGIHVVLLGQKQTDKERITLLGTYGAGNVPTWRGAISTLQIDGKSERSIDVEIARRRDVQAMALPGELNELHERILAGEYEDVVRALGQVAQPVTPLPLHAKAV